MKTTFQKLTCFAALLGTLAFTFGANADFLLEPYLGYHVGKIKQGSVSDTAKGVSLGGRVGFQTVGFMGGLDYMTGSWTDDHNPNRTLTPTDLGVFVGFNFPVMLRVYGVYNFSTKMKMSGGGVNQTLDGGDGIKLGVGFTGLPFVSVNLEYITQTYKKADGATMLNQVENNMYGLTVSLPLNL